MARAPDQKYLSPNPGYRKGDRHSGGGAHGAAGGKKRRPQERWEKGDVARDVDAEHRGESPVPVKPGRLRHHPRRRRTGHH